MAREVPPQGAADTNAEVEVSHEELYWMKWVSLETPSSFHTAVSLVIMTHTSMSQVLLCSEGDTKTLFIWCILSKRSRVLSHSRGVLKAATLNFSSIIILPEFSLPVTGLAPGDTNKP